MTTATDELWILGGARTAMAEYSGTPGFGKLKDVGAMDLGAWALKGALARTGIKPEQIDHTVIGNALQTTEYSIYGARHVALKAGVPIDKPALTVNRLCGSGIQSIVSAAQMIRCGEAHVVAAGGMESMSQAPHVLRGARTGLRFGAKTELEDLLFSSLQDPMCGLFMAQTAEKIAKKWGITREAQDEFALRSHQLGAEAVKSGRFAAEIVPVEIQTRKGVIKVDLDDHIKPETTLAGLAGLPAAFGKDGTVTAGNASGIVDGAAAVIVASATRAKELGVKPLGRIVAWSIVGVEPSEMGIGPAPAIRQVCERAGIGVDKIDLFEINEAFSAQYLAVEKDLGLDRSKVNVNGGAIALGHPLGATGTRITLTLLNALKASGKKTGIASACIGGGQGIAILVEAK
ncbi:MAG: acetyl-CoA C-acetyltransferase [Planctomycetes bacterium]|nr:acetyl-CoA C-acetyltransferase [Planctomycetota bacterium]MCC7171851.1 acetyl-CoA C-acetyltransferase [Planctomycetota bacterium]